MPFGPFALQWSTPSPNPPLSNALPDGITRSSITTPSGPLELLTALPSISTPTPERDLTPLFFAHGGFGCAEVWLDYMLYFSSRGYPCYAISYRGHGKSWYPSFWRMFFTPRSSLAGDLVAGIEYVERLEGKRTIELLGRECETPRVVLIAHSNGGQLAQYVLSRKLAKVHAFCMFAAVPGFGSFKVYRYWAPTAPFHMLYRLCHPRYILANTSQVKGSFFTPDTPWPVVHHLERLLSPYESFAWPLQGLIPFVNARNVVSSIMGWRLRSASASGISTPMATPRIRSRLLVIAGEHDVLCTPSVLQDAAMRYRAAFRQMLQEGKLDGLDTAGERGHTANEHEDGDEGVSFRVIKGVAHHIQNHVEWQKGAEEILQWAEQL